MSLLTGDIYADTSFDRDALAGFKRQAQLYPFALVAEQAYEPGHFSAQNAARMLAEKKPNYVFFFGGQAALRTLAVVMSEAKLSVPLLTSMVMLGHSVFKLPPSVTEQVWLTYPMGLPKPVDFVELAELLRKSGQTLRNPAFQSIAFSAAKVLVEAAKLSGRQLNRATLQEKLESLREFQTGVLPPVTFSSNRRVGAIGSYVVRVDAENRRYVPLTDWLVPRND